MKYRVFVGLIDGGKWKQQELKQINAYSDRAAISKAKHLASSLGIFEYDCLVCLREDQFLYRTKSIKISDIEESIEDDYYATHHKRLYGSSS